MGHVVSITLHGEHSVGHVISITLHMERLRLFPGAFPAGPHSFDFTAHGAFTGSRCFDYAAQGAFAGSSVGKTLERNGK